MDKWVVWIVVFLIGMLLAHMLKDVCGCKVVEGLDGGDDGGDCDDPAQTKVCIDNHEYFDESVSVCQEGKEKCCDCLVLKKNGYCDDSKSNVCLTYNTIKDQTEYVPGQCSKDGKAKCCD